MLCKDEVGVLNWICLFCIAVLLFLIGYWVLLGFLDFSVMVVALVLTAGCAAGIWYFFVYEKEAEDDGAADGDVES